MYCHPFGDLPIELEELNTKWFWLTVAWIKRYLEYVCGEPPLEGHVGASEETEWAEITDEVSCNVQDGRIPKAMSLFYDDGAYQEYEPYYEKCVSAYSQFVANLQWHRLNPDMLREYFDDNQYALNTDAPYCHEHIDDGSLPTRINQDYEIIGLLPPSVLRGHGEWRCFVIRLFVDYWKLFLSNTDSQFICIHHVFCEGWVGNDYKTWKMPEGVGLGWKRREEGEFNRFLEISRLIWAHFLTSINWATIEAEKQA